MADGSIYIDGSLFYQQFLWLSSMAAGIMQPSTDKWTGVCLSRTAPASSSIADAFVLQQLLVLSDAVICAADVEADVCSDSKVVVDRLHLAMSRIIKPRRQARTESTCKQRLCRARHRPSSRFVHHQLKFVRGGCKYPGRAARCTARCPTHYEGAGLRSVAQRGSAARTVASEMLDVAFFVIGVFTLSSTPCFALLAPRPRSGMHACKSLTRMATWRASRKAMFA